MQSVVPIIGLLFIGWAMAPAVAPRVADAPSAEFPAPPVSEHASQTGKVTILAVGDVMLGRYVGTLMEQRGSAYPFERLDGLFDGYDHVLVNLEGPITDVNLNPAENPRSTMQFHFAPSVARTLRDEGVTIANLANNHSLDQGGEGLRDTRELLDVAGILHSGTATNDPGFFAVATTTNDVPLIFVGFNATWPHDPEAMLAYLKTQTDDVFIIVSVHWGEEYALTQNDAQRKLAHALIDAGADMIVGHHPHVVQGIEQYRGKLIFYSMGNFIFDQYFSKDVEEGLTLGITIEKAGVRVHIIPLASVQSQPTVMESSRGEEFLAAVATRSDPALRAAIISGIIKP